MIGSVIPGILIWICGIAVMVAFPARGKRIGGSWRMGLCLGLMVGGAVFIAKGIARSVAASFGPGTDELLIGLAIFVLIYVAGFPLAALAGHINRGDERGGEGE